MRYGSSLYRFRTTGVTERLILVNVGVFVIFILLKIFAFLFQSESFIVTIQDWLVVPSDLHKLVFRPWTVITYAFMHAGFWHILGNMLILYFAGRFFMTYFSPRQMLNYYFMGALVGALFFLLSYNVFPVFQQDREFRLLGASAAVMAILVGVATYAPNMMIRFFIVNLKLWWIAAFFVAKDLISIPIDNPGGHIAHLGGAALGFFYSRQLLRGHDIGGGFERVMDRVVGIFSSTSPKTAKTPFKKVYRNKTKPTAERGAYESHQPRRSASHKEKQEKIDAILDKISKNGYDSLSKEEKEFLFSVSED